MYAAYQMHRALFDPVRGMAGIGLAATAALPRPLRTSAPVRAVAGLYEVVSGSRLTHVRPSFGLSDVLLDGEPRRVVERPVDGTPFATLVHFAVDRPGTRPAVLVAAPLSGHFATMLAPTVKTLLRDHDVYITDWHNARDVMADHGGFGFQDYVDHLIRFQRFLGPGGHLVAVCQPCVPALVATAVLAQAGDPAQPRTLTLMSGPIDPRINPTRVNATASDRPLEWFERRCITTVPRRYPGAGRRVYPGFMQVSGFMALNLRRHLSSHARMYRDLAVGDVAAARATQDFYREYFAVLDIAAEFYLETVRDVFQEHLLPRGLMRHRGEPVELSAIERTAVLTVEAQLDDMCAPGQTSAVHDLLPHLADGRRGRYVQPGVGHYGIFAGRRWDHEVYPLVRDFIAAHRVVADALA